MTDSSPQPLPPAVGNKFHADGTVRFYPGNTVICHLDAQQAFHTHLVDFCQRLKQLGFAQKLTFLPPETYHVTLICGIDDQMRGVHGWPRDLPLDAPLAVGHAFFAARLRTFCLRERPPYRLCAADFKPTGSDLVLNLQAASAPEAYRLRRLRSDLADTLGLPVPKLTLHFTLGYLVAWLTSQEEHRLQLEKLAFLERVCRDGLLIELGLPEYCQFRDMFHFERQFYLGAGRDGS